MKTIDPTLAPAARALVRLKCIHDCMFSCRSPCSTCRCYHPGFSIFSSGFYITPALLGGGKVVMIAEYISVQMSETLKWGLATSLGDGFGTPVVLALTIAMKPRHRDIGDTGKKA